MNILNSDKNISLPELLKRLQTDPENGLTSQNVFKSRSQYGSNAIEEIKPTPLYELVLDGIKQPMMVLLLSVAAVSFVFGKVTEAFAMIFVVVAYILVEFINKYRSDRTMARLRALTSPTARVVRDGKEKEIPVSDVVVGDIVFVSEGTVIPADIRLVTSSGLVVNEAPLTGESMPVAKDADIQESNTIFQGTSVVNGQATGVVISVGQKTEFGKIAKSVQRVHKERTILQESMTRLSKILAIIAIAISGLIPVIGFLQGLPAHEMVLTWLSLTFLMIPGQPPIIITMALALAAFELTKKKVVIKRLRGAELIGQITMVLSDKTGTITENKMVVEKFILPDGTEIESSNLPDDIRNDIAFSIARYSNDSTDRAVMKAVGKTPPDSSEMPNYFKGFSAKQPWRDLVYKFDNKMRHFIAGNPELLLDASSSASHKKLSELIQTQASSGKRIIAYAFIDHDNRELHHLKNLTLIAIAVLHDPVRSGVKEAIEVLNRAGVKTYMVTGDHPATARAVARHIGLPDEVIIGEKLDAMSDEALAEVLDRYRVFARTSSLQKMRLVKITESRGQRVAVIGDGINDAPAIKAADVGIAMGEIATDLAKEIADMVLTDDSYVHVPDAVRISRKALDNFKKGLVYYLSAKGILLAVFLVPLLLKIPFPFSPLQIIAIEILMDLASSTIFVTEPEEPDLMNHPFPNIDEFLDWNLIGKILLYGVGLACGITFIYLHMYYKTHDLAMAQTAAFATWLIGHILLALNLKKRKKPLLLKDIHSSPVGFFWLSAMIILCIAITNISLLYPLFNSTHLPLNVWFQVIFIAVISTCWIQIFKIIKWNY